MKPAARAPTPRSDLKSSVEELPQSVVEFMASINKAGIQLQSSDFQEAFTQLKSTDGYKQLVAKTRVEGGIGTYIQLRLAWLNAKATEYDGQSEEVIYDKATEYVGGRKEAGRKRQSRVG